MEKIEQIPNAQVHCSVIHVKMVLAQKMYIKSDIMILISNVYVLLSLFYLRLFYSVSHT